MIIIRHQGEDARQVVGPGAQLNHFDVKLREFAGGQGFRERQPSDQVRFERLQFRAQPPAPHLRAQLAQRAFERNARFQHSGQLLVHEGEFFVFHGLNIRLNSG